MPDLRVSVRMALAAIVCAAAVAAVPCPASAQALSRVSLDSVSAADLFRGGGTTGNPDASLDISSVVRLGGGWSVHLRPWFFKSSANDSEWSKEIYQAAARYERAGTTSVRLDAGYIASPIGVGMLDMRADINPTIQPHLSYFVPLLPFDRGAPGVGAIKASYPLGVHLAVSTARWDARMAVVNSAPTRRYALHAEYGNPRPTPVAIAGGGVTLAPGLRVGTSFASGHYATAEEVGDPSGDARTLRMWTAEGEYARGYTRLVGEFTHERFQHGSSGDTAATWFAQATETLSPRWFAAARHEVVSAPAMEVSGPGAPRLTFRTSEGTLGYRVTPEVTLRSSITVQRWYTAPASDRRIGAQIVWSRRWW